MFYFKKVRKIIMPSKERRQEIESIVSGIIQSNNKLNVPAFDVVDFLQSEGFVIGEQPMDDDTTGMLLVDDTKYLPNTQTHRLIVVNSSLQENDNYIQKRRFITTHEYGHFVLHKNDINQFAHRDTSKKDSTQEKEADFFARCLLMPRALIDEALKFKFLAHADFSQKIKIIARLFNVTEKKSKQRLVEDLGYNG